ncbi:MAG TPA: hypothetical protein VD735_05745, partial [Candidatus Saccharimonadales bacterium]|nr:hypothetical protein [Candidatus Saccharimonadales bacterium]
MIYSEALARGNPALAHEALWQGPQFDPGLGMTVVGDYDNGQEIFANQQGAYSNRGTLAPWFSPNSLARWALRSTLSHPDSLQTLEGVDHDTVRAIVDTGMREVTTRDDYATFLYHVSDGEACQARARLQATGTTDLKASADRIRAMVLGMEFGLPRDMRQQLIASGDDYAILMGGYPVPP